MSFISIQSKQKSKWRISIVKNIKKKQQQITQSQQEYPKKDLFQKFKTIKFIHNRPKSTQKNNSSFFYKTTSKFNQTNQKKSQDHNIKISEDQKQRMYGVFPKHLQKKYIIGKGAVSVIWLAYDINLQKNVAVKQFLKDTKQSYDRQKRFVKQLQKLNTTDNFIKFNYYLNIGPADFIVYQLGGKSLSKSLYQIKGQFHKNQRVYRIIFTDLYYQIIKPLNLKKLIKQLAQGVLNLGNGNFAHNDLKPQNILIDQNKDIKICDYGSVTLLNDSQMKNMITPQYMPPEILMGYTSNNADIWSIGIIIIQILNGIPIWMYYKCWIHQNNYNMLCSGLLAIRGKAYDKILLKIQNLLRNLKKSINYGTLNYSGHEIQLLINLLRGILQINPENRLTAEQILKHQFLK